MLGFHSNKTTDTYNRPSTFQLVGYATLRFFQFASAVLVMSLVAYAIHAYGFHGSKKTNFVLAVGVIGTFYNMALLCCSIIAPKLVFAGFYFLIEVVMCMLWFAAFIVDAKVQGDHGCKVKHVSSYDPKYGSLTQYQDADGEYDPFTHKYSTKDVRTGCRSAKASIAFAGLAWALFLISSIFVGLNILNPVIAHYGTSGLFKTGTSMGTRVDRPSALTLVDPIESNYAPEDVEAATATNAANVPVTNTTGQNPNVANTADQHTMSSGNSARDAQEKSEASA